jgi:hypothetical protein
MTGKLYVLAIVVVAVLTLAKLDSFDPVEPIKVRTTLLSCKDAESIVYTWYTKGSYIYDVDTNERYYYWFCIPLNMKDVK